MQPLWSQQQPQKVTKIFFQKSTGHSLSYKKAKIEIKSGAHNTQHTTHNTFQYVSKIVPNFLGSKIEHHQYGTK